MLARMSYSPLHYSYKEDISSIYTAISEVCWLAYDCFLPAFELRLALLLLHGQITLLHVCNGVCISVSYR